MGSAAGCGDITTHSFISFSLIPLVRWCRRLGAGLGPGNRGGSCLALTFRDSGSSAAACSRGQLLAESLGDRKGLWAGASTALSLGFPL